MKIYRLYEWKDLGNFTFVDLNNNLITGRVYLRDGGYFTIKDGKYHNECGSMNHPSHNHWYLEGKLITNK